MCDHWCPTLCTNSNRKSLRLLWHEYLCARVHVWCVHVLLVVSHVAVVICFGTCHVSRQKRKHAQGCPQSANPPFRDAVLITSKEGRGKEGQSKNESKTLSRTNWLVSSISKPIPLYVSFTETNEVWCPKWRQGITEVLDHVHQVTWKVRALGIKYYSGWATCRRPVQLEERSQETASACSPVDATSLLDSQPSSKWSFHSMFFFPVTLHETFPTLQNPLRHCQGEARCACVHFLFVLFFCESYGPMTRHFV